MTKQFRDTLRRIGRAGWWIPVAAFALTAMLWTAALAMFGFYPFGGHSILITDLGQQYIEYHAALYDAVHNGEGVFYTWNTGLGMDFIGVFAYYLASPFTLILFLFPRHAIVQAVLVILSLKIATAGLTFSLFLRRAVGVRGPLAVMFAVMYALSAYPVTYFFNLMWLDAVVLLPLVLWAVKHTADTRRIGGLTTVLAVLFFSNFYTAYMVGLFCFLALLALLWLRGLWPARERRRECLAILLRFFGAAALAAGLTAFLTLPTAFSLYNAQNGAASWLFWGLTTDPLSLLSKMTWGAYDSVTDAGTAYLYSGILTLGLMPVWAFHSGIPRREKKAIGILIAVLLVSMLWSPLDYVWHAFETPVWFPARYSFVLIFVLLTCAARALSLRDGLTPRRLAAGFACAAGLALAVKLPEWLFPDICHTMSGSLWVTLGGLALYAVLLLPVSRKGKLRRPALMLLAVVVCAELVGNTLVSMENLDKELRFEEHTDYPAFIEKSTELRTALGFAAEQDGVESEFFRAENTLARNANDGMSAGYHAVSHYSSFSRRNTFAFLRNAGMFCVSGNKIFRYYGATGVLDSLLGVRYVLAPEERRAGYTHTGLEANGIPLWRNENALPLAFYADAESLSLPSSAATPFALQNQWLQALDNTHSQTEYYTPLDTHVSFSGGSIQEQGERQRLIAEKETATLSIAVQNPHWQHVLLYLNNNLPEYTVVSLNGVPLNKHGERLIRSVIELGNLPPGEAVVSFSVPGNSRWYTGLSAAGFDADAFRLLVERLREHTPHPPTVTRTGLGMPIVSGQFTAPQDGALFTSVPAHRGWVAEIDGERVRPAAVGGAFLAVSVPAGQHDFTLQYRPPGLWSGIILSTLTALFCVGWLLRTRKRHTPLPAGFETAASKNRGDETLG